MRRSWKVLLPFALLLPFVLSVATCRDQVEIRRDHLRAMGELKIVERSPEVYTRWVDYLRWVKFKMAGTDNVELTVKEVKYDSMFRDGDVVTLDCDWRGNIFMVPVGRIIVE